MTDEQLMANVTNGKIDDLAILFDRYHIRIYNFLFKMSNDKNISEDLTQDVFVKVLRHKKTFQQTNFKSWIYTIARNTFATHYQKSKKQWLEVVTDEITDNIEEEKNNKEEIKGLYDALQKLSESDRELIVMHRLQGMQYSVIAGIIKSSEGAVKVKMHRAIKKLKEIYSSAY